MPYRDAIAASLPPGRRYIYSKSEEPQLYFDWQRYARAHG